MTGDKKTAAVKECTTTLVVFNIPALILRWGVVVAC
jgi:hypothetical protein